MRAAWDSRSWSFVQTYKDEPDWTPILSPSLEDYESLRDFLWRKYQRKRLPHRIVEQIDKKIAEMKEQMEANS